MIMIAKEQLGTPSPELSLSLPAASSYPAEVSAFFILVTSSMISIALLASCMMIFREASLKANTNASIEIEIEMGNTIAAINPKLRLLPWVRLLAFIPNQAVKKLMGRKIIVTIVNNKIILPCLAETSACRLEDLASKTLACFCFRSI
jgi:hypothetical protein